MRLNTATYAAAARTSKRIISQHGTTGKPWRGRYGQNIARMVPPGRAFRQPSRVAWVGFGVPGPAACSLQERLGSGAGRRHAQPIAVWVFEVALAPRETFFIDRDPELGRDGL